jgi:hypothetical protein
MCPACVSVSRPSSPLSFLTKAERANSTLASILLNHTYFRKWGAYTGLMLEHDWCDPQRRIYDLTFRSLIILYYVER